MPPAASACGQGARHLAEAQLRGFLLVTLLVFHEIRSVLAVIGSETPNRSSAEGWEQSRAPKNSGREKWIASKEIDDVAFRKPQASVQSLAESGGGAKPRSLLETVGTAAGWAWPANTLLTLGTRVSGLDTYVSDANEVVVCAGVPYQSIEISADGRFEGHTVPHVRLAQPSSDRANCHENKVAVSYAIRQDGTAGSQYFAFADMGITNNVDTNTNSPMYVTPYVGLQTAVFEKSNARIHFMHGGLFRICYSPDLYTADKTFGSAGQNILPMQIRVLGVISPCSNGYTDGCLGRERWDCNFGIKAEYSPACVLSVTGERSGWGVEAGSKSMMSWSDPWQPDIPSGLGITFNPKECLEKDPDAEVFNTSSSYREFNTTTAATLPPLSFGRVSAVTVTACYCPSFSRNMGAHCTEDNANECCGDTMDFMQQFGLIYFWTIRICDSNNYETCDTPYMRVVPQQKFLLRVECPPGGGCEATETNRIKYIEQSPDNDLPSWHSGHGCRHTSVESSAAVWPLQSDSIALSGGDRTDYKYWGIKQAKLALTLGQKLDLCYCHSAPENPESWFKVGQVQTTNVFALSSRTDEDAASSLPTVRYVNGSGSLTLYGGISRTPSLAPNPFESNKYSGEALVNIISFDREPTHGGLTLEQHYGFDEAIPSNFQSIMDAECAHESYSDTLVNGPSSKDLAKKYKAQVDIAANTVSSYLSFSGPGKNHRMTITKAGVVSICYCAMVLLDECSHADHWIFAGRFTIQGPTGGQTWVLPVGSPRSLIVNGWGLSSTDRFRLIPLSGFCSQNDPYGVITYKTWSYSAGHWRTATPSEHAEMMVLTSDNSGVSITSVKLEATHTTLETSSSVKDLFEDDDIVTLGLTNARVNGKSPASWTDDERHAAYRLSGIYEFQDTYESSEATESFQAGHRVTKVSANSQATHLQIPVGWEGSAGYSFEVNSWTRRNKAEVRVRGTQADQVKVCWGPGTNGELFAEIGQLSFVGSITMESASVHLTGVQDNAITPVIISFKTSARAPYDEVAGTSTLTLRFPTAKVSPMRAGNGEENNLPMSASTFAYPSTHVDRSQNNCGLMLQELWSSHSEGFPLPLGCAYTDEIEDATDGQFRELSISFNDRNGLRAGEVYYVVVNTNVQGIVSHDGLVAIYSDCDSETGCPIQTRVLETALAIAASTTKEAATNTQSQFAPTDGFYLENDDLTSNRKFIQFRLRSDDQKSIIGGCFVRMYLWPLTQWNMGSNSCVANCLATQGDPTPCGNVEQLICSAEEVVSGSGRWNIIKLKLPFDIQPITTDFMQSFRIRNLQVPPGGIFPTRLGAQVSQADDTAPHYVISSGMAIFTSAPPSPTSGMLVLTDRIGYGPRPFAGDYGTNTLSVRMQFGAVLRSLQTAVASIEVHLPEGYTCSVEGLGSAPAGLEIFTKDSNNDKYPDHNRGILSTRKADGNWSKSSMQTCIYEIATNGAVFAGQVAYVQVTVSNPANVKAKQDDDNQWFIKFKQTEDLITYEHLIPFISLEEEDHYFASNVAVISRVASVSLQPFGFALGEPQSLRVLFQTTRAVGADGFVVLDAPDGFDFSSSCRASNLHASYYLNSNVFPLKGINACFGAKYPTTAATFNRAIISVSDHIGSDNVHLNYGFEIRVRFSVDYTAVQHNSWYLWTQDTNRYTFEGSYESIPFNPMEEPKYRLMDGCSADANTQVATPRYAAPSLGVGKVQCCSSDGSSCARQSNGKCLNSDDEFDAMKTFHEAFMICYNVGMRLCNTQAEVDLCCGGECNVDNFTVWTSAVEATEFYRHSWGMYNAGFSDLLLVISGVAPFSKTQRFERLQVWPLHSFPNASSLRLTAPAGYRWNTDVASSFSNVVHDATAEFPFPDAVRTSNELEWSSVSLHGGGSYITSVRHLACSGPVTLALEHRCSNFTHVAVSVSSAPLDACQAAVLAQCTYKDKFMFEAAGNKCLCAVDDCSSYEADNGTDVFETCVFADAIYGFAAEVQVPDQVSAPLSPAHAFFVEFGYMQDDISQRTNASMLTPRVLLDVYSGWRWPTEQSLSFATMTLVANGVHWVTVSSGVLYDTIELKVDGWQFTANHSSPMVKLVKGKAQDCSPIANAAVGLNPTLKPTLVAGSLGLTEDPLPLSLGTIFDGHKLTASSASIIFMLGGSYRLCYSPDGTFGAEQGHGSFENIVNTQIRVLGVSSECLGNYADGCMESERWECSHGYAGAHCIFNFQAGQGRIGWDIETGNQSRMTWSAAWVADDVLDDGQRGSSHPQLCASTDPEMTLLDISQAASALLHIDKTTSAILPPVKADHLDAFTLTACYCPSFSAGVGTLCDGSNDVECCMDARDFVQPFGIIYYWTLWICDVDDFESCAQPYKQVFPQQQFVPRLQCPPGGGCANNNANRIKFIEYQAMNDAPSWELGNGCKQTLIESSEAVWPSPWHSQALSGGDRVDYKAWGAHQVKFNLGLNQRLDVCYCNAEPDNPVNWFKVGEVHTAKVFAFASTSSYVPSAAIPTVTYAGHPGSLTFLGGITSSGNGLNPYDSNRFSNKALINIMSYDREYSEGRSLEKDSGAYLSMPADFHARMDAECQKELYSATLVSGLHSKEAAQAYVANPGLLGNTSRYLTFSGDTQNKKITINAPGVVAFCYCAMLDSVGACADSSDWMFAGRMTIRGPAASHEWVFPTHIAVTLTMSGWGFTAFDRIRIIPSTDDCTLDPSGVASYRVDCPGVNGTGCGVATVGEEVQMNVLTSAATGTFVATAATESTQTILHFSDSTNGVLDNGDIITLGVDDILVDGNLAATMIESQRHAAFELSGEYEFQDDPSQSFLLGHRISHAVIDGARDYTSAILPLGWKSDPIFSFLGGRGSWTRRNKETSVRIKGIEEQMDLKVCWGVAHPGKTVFYAEAGKISFVRPRHMKQAHVYLTTRQKAAVAPVVISFTTSGGEPAYTRVGESGETTLMLRFIDSGRSDGGGKLDPRLASDDHAQGFAAELDAEGAETLMQSNCGKLFLEVWSSHMEGFPLPAGCRYSEEYKDLSTAANSTRSYREIYLKFGIGNGLRSSATGEEYQFVLNANLGDISVNDALVEIFSMCDDAHCQIQDLVIERATATASLSTQDKAGATDPHLSRTGFQLQYTNSDGFVDLSTLDALQVKLQGGDGPASIRGASFLRIYLRPLMLWNIGAHACSASCISSHTPFYFLNQTSNTSMLVDAHCGSPVDCIPDEVVFGSDRRSVIKLRLPTTMDAITSSIMHTIKIANLALPPDGFFPTRVGVQLTNNDDRTPSYVASIGLLMLAAQNGVARIVSTGRSGCGPRPFAGDRLNTLYVKLIFTTTVRNYGMANGASIQIHLPPGYACAVTGDGAPPKTLKVFDVALDGYSASNRGLLSTSVGDGSWDRSHAGICVYTFESYGAVFAGQVAYAALTVDNPTHALLKENHQNEWKMMVRSCVQTMAARCLHMLPVTSFAAPSSFFSDASGLYASNCAVINPLAQESLQPSSFAISSPSRPNREYLRVFFQIAQDIGENGYVLLDAPDGFDFSQTCDVRDLHDNYYSTGGPSGNLMRLRNVHGCTSTKYPRTATSLNRAQIQVGGQVGSSTGKLNYGFEIFVTHPEQYNTGQHHKWFLFATNSQGHAIAGSDDTIPFNPESLQSEFYRSSWGMYQSDATGIDLQLSNSVPYANTLAYAKVSVSPFAVKADVETSLRITAPVGFTWNPNVINTFEKTVKGAQSEFPIPTLQGSNELIWPRLSLMANIRYGFAAEIKVPSYNPVMSSKAFFFELGYLSTSIIHRYQAARIEFMTTTTTTVPVQLAKVTWAVRGGGEGYDYGSRVVVDATHVFVQGSFGLWKEKSATFGATHLPNANGVSMFEAMLTHSGEFLSAVSARRSYQLPHPPLRQPGQETDGPRTLSLFDALGNRYDTGRFRDTRKFGSVIRTSSGFGDIFVTKHNNAGILQWASTWGGSGDDAGSSIAADGQGNIFLAGIFTDDLDIGGKVLHSASGTASAFVAKLNSKSGGVVWVQQISGSGAVVAYGIAADAEGQIFVAGSFQGAALFGNLKLTAVGKRDGFVTKLDSNGMIEWAGRVGGAGDDACNAVSTGADSGIYVAGHFEGVAEFSATELKSVGSGDVFVSRWLDVTGTNASALGPAAEGPVVYE